MDNDIESSEKLRELTAKGVEVIDPRQTYISADVFTSRIHSGSVLYPGTRLTGARTLIGTGAQIGTEGPAVIQNSIIGANAEVASGFMSGAVMLPDSRAGANSHFRAGTLLEEYASTAHAVGLKQTILMYSVTLGSLINFCDVLISGGRSRGEHSEVGSGFIHFNFAPWGKNGNKATPSLLGNVPDGVFLDSERIFLGGMSGIAGPVSIGFGALTTAGQVIRESVPDSTMHAEAGRAFDKTRNLSAYRLTEAHIQNVRSRNIRFISELYALQAWYSQVRLHRSLLSGDMELALVLAGAFETIADCIDERTMRYNSFAKEWSAPLIEADVQKEYSQLREPAPDWKPELKHDEWVRQLSAHEKTSLRGWLESIVHDVGQKLESE